MDQRTADALEESILHWQDISKATPQTMPALDLGSTSCALCGLFFAKTCEGCPVAKKTKNILCTGSPYVLVCWARDKGYFTDFIAFAEDEVTFLQSLREPVDA